jgi:hypothetical protein
MSKAILLFLLSFFTHDLFSQFYIRGRVTDNESQLPLKDASVYINNSTKGSRTDDNGDFVLGPFDAGRYEVVASYVGYYPVLYTAEITNASYRISFKLDKKGTLLSEVLVLTKETRERYLEIFKQNLLGVTTAAKHCVIKNIEEVQFISGKNKDEIVAYTEKELEIENPDLGYTIYFELLDFYYSKVASSMYFYGYSRYVDWLKDSQPNKKLLRKRKQVYEGSIMHFFRSLVNKQLDKEGFRVYQLRPPQKPIVDTPANNGAFIENKIDEQQVPTTSVEDSLIRLYQDSVYRIYELRIKNGWNVVYAGNTDLKKEIMNKNLIWQPQSGTISGLRLKESPVLVSENGILLTPMGLSFNGVWAFERLANMLPKDYTVK